MVHSFQLRNCAALLAFMAAGCAENPPLVQTSQAVHNFLTDKDREALSPERRRLYDAAIAHTLLDARVADYQASFDTADEIRRDGHTNKPTYYGFEIGKARYTDGPVELRITVDDGKITSVELTSR